MVLSLAQLRLTSTLWLRLDFRFGCSRVGDLLHPVPVAWCCLHWVELYEHIKQMHTTVVWT